jgi:hypothetical protein
VLDGKSWCRRDGALEHLQTAAQSISAVRRVALVEK